ncbi:MAG: prohibitin family protein [Bernardetiaceae bacterium]|nr:prohibitin family protein [Bernardetiaceae bacterium]
MKIQQKTPKIWAVSLVILVFMLGSCAIIRQDEVGVKRKLGKLDNKIKGDGAKLINPFTTVMLTVPIRTVNMKVEEDLPTKEGLNVRAQISILYKIERSRAIDILREVGINYEDDLIKPVFRSSIADVSAQFMAKDMHSGGGRTQIEQAVTERMRERLAGRGFDIEGVLMKNIKLPAGLSRAIEEKLQAEQESQRMEFVIMKEKQEADRRKIEAQGLKEANEIVAESLSPVLLQFLSIEAFRELGRSNNAKVIVTDGKTPFLIQD